jgi:hypothetical protein
MKILFYWNPEQFSGQLYRHYEPFDHYSRQCFEILMPLIYSLINLLHIQIEIR